MAQEEYKGKVKIELFRFTGNGGFQNRRLAKFVARNRLPQLRFFLFTAKAVQKSYSKTRKAKELTFHSSDKRHFYF